MQKRRGGYRLRNLLYHLMPETGLEPALPLQEPGPQANLRPLDPQGVHTALVWDLVSLLKVRFKVPGHPHCTHVGSVWAIVLAKR